MMDQGGGGGFAIGARDANGAWPEACAKRQLYIADDFSPAALAFMALGWLKGMPGRGRGHQNRLKLPFRV